MSLHQPTYEQKCVPDELTNNTKPLQANIGRSPSSSNSTLRRMYCSRMARLVGSVWTQSCFNSQRVCSYRLVACVSQRCEEFAVWCRPYISIVANHVCQTLIVVDSELVMCYQRLVALQCSVESTSTQHIVYSLISLIDRKCCMLNCLLLTKRLCTEKKNSE